MPGAWELFETIARLFCGGLLTVAGTWKLSSSRAWRQVWMASYQMLPSPLVAPVALLLPIVELGCGIAVLLGALGEVSVFAAAALYTLFALAVASVRVRGLKVPCGCIPWLEKLASSQVVVRNLVFLAALVAVAWHGLSAPSVGGLRWQVEVAAVIGGVGAVSVAIRLIHGWQRRRVIAVLIAAATAGSTEVVADADEDKLTVATPAEADVSLAERR